MRASRSTTLTLVAVATLVLGACGDPGSGGGEADPTSSGTVRPRHLRPDRRRQARRPRGRQGPAERRQHHPGGQQGRRRRRTRRSSSCSTRCPPRSTPTSSSSSTRRSTSTGGRRARSPRSSSTPRSWPPTDAAVGAGTSLVIGAANFSESATLAEIYAAVLRTAGFTVEVRPSATARRTCPPLADGTLTAVPEYAATLADFLNAQQNGADAESVASADVDATVAALTPLAEAAGLTVGAAVGRAGPERVRRDQRVRRRARRDDAQRPRRRPAAAWCWPVRPSAPSGRSASSGLEETYGLEFADFKSYDFGLIGQAVLKGEAAIGLVLSSDGSLAG